MMLPHVNVKIIYVFGVPLSGRSSKRARVFDNTVISRDRTTVNVITDTVGITINKIPCDGGKYQKFQFSCFSNRVFRTLVGRAVVLHVIGPGRTALYRCIFRRLRTFIGSSTTMSRFKITSDFIVNSLCAITIGTGVAEYSTNVLFNKTYVKYLKESYKYVFLCI